MRKNNAEEELVDVENTEHEHILITFSENKFTCTEKMTTKK